MFTDRARTEVATLRAAAANTVLEDRAAGGNRPALTEVFERVGAWGCNGGVAAGPTGGGSLNDLIEREAGHRGIVLRSVNIVLRSVKRRGSARNPAGPLVFGMAALGGPCARAIDGDRETGRLVGKRTSPRVYATRGRCSLTEPAAPIQCRVFVLSRPTPNRRRNNNMETMVARSLLASSAPLAALFAAVIGRQRTVGQGGR